MKIILIVSFLLYSLVYSNENYPSIYAQLGTPIYKSSKDISKLRDIDVLRYEVINYLENKKQTLDLGIKADKSTNKNFKKDYLKQLRKLEKQHNKIIAYTRKRLLDAVEKKDTNIFNKITNIDLPQLYKSKDFNDKVLNYYKQNNKQNNKFLNKQIKELAYTQSNNKSTIEIPKNIKNLKDKNLFNKISILLNSYYGEVGAFNNITDLSNELYRRDPDSKYSLVIKARIELHMGYIRGDNYSKEHIKKARSLVLEAIKKDPNFFDAQNFLATTYIVEHTSQGLQKAKNIAEKSKNMSSSPFRKEFLNAKIAKEEKNYKRAADIAKNILKNTDEIWVKTACYSHLTTYYRSIKEYKKVHELYQEDIKLNPDSPWALVNYASFLNRIKDYKQAIIYANRSLQLRDFGMAHYHLAKGYYGIASKLLYDEKKYNDSIEYFTKSIQHNPTHENSYYGFAHAHYQVGYKTKNIPYLKKAKIAYEQTLQIDPKHKQANKELKRLNKLLNYLGI
ncbi:hypothetical protein FJR48_07850 [Sulfurimonas lithotrophica]|uniref:Tetratricopeptide repeat protein n=1 Tax=Sulfurimonas lithotrophica TaxID=2590022 RepID=A0A5P8P1P3_9BACT|nr:hypothetical protein [Sulfurimonas lithotrophica]QFR49648.1 hypothetical protein FJR48_07850 [Sulfurimonas lithotrophica]